MPTYYVHPDIAKAETISTDVYLNPEVFSLSKEKIFAPSWQFIGDTNLVKENGSVHPFTLLEHSLDEPLLMTRDQDGVLHCLSNVCTHRGNLVVNQPCKQHHLQCKYHGRRFQLDGTFSFMPEFSEVDNFPSERDHLKSLPVFQWGKWLFTTLKQGNPAASYFADMIRRLEWLPIQDFHFRADLSRDYVVEANWALYCENYLEGFHIPFVHAGLNAVIDYGTYTTELFQYSNLQLGLAKEGEMAFDLPSSSPDYGKRVGGYYFWIFPNMMFNFYPWGLSINIVKPVGISKTVVSFLTYVWDESKLEQGAGSDLFRVEMEDEEVVQAVQKGIRSRFYTHGRYSVTREQGTHHFHRLLAEAISQV
ncbi:MAG: aromatic ring-hydroxylating dioxygenase subunit alpha [Saprospiraceae bacterium]|nr:aromatic ring-hydroxylating dioxygenase subunit alpha [Candidatus Opimibacter skivensis]